MKRFFIIIMACSIVSIIASRCKKDDFVPADRGALITLTLNGTLSREEICERITEFNGHDAAMYDVTFYAVTYRTEYLGKPIDSKGLLILPDGIDTICLILYCHGTEIPSNLLGAKKITPSTYKGDAETHRDVRNMGLGWASAGYAVFIPDYIGYGATLGKDHPYLCYEEMFKSNFDGLLAVKKIIDQKGLSYDNRLFLTGWSQGAGAALSAHKYIQQYYSSQFTVAATSGLAGPYNFERTAIETLKRQNEEIAILPIISWGIYSLNKFTSLKRPTDQIYTFPVYDQLSSVLLPSNKPSQVFNAHFLANVLNGNDLTFLSELKGNSFHRGWCPVGKVFLHHADADKVVPYYNSQDAYAGLTAAGGDVTFYTYPGGGHDTELGNYILQTLHDFNLMK